MMRRCVAKESIIETYGEMFSTELIRRSIIRQVYDGEAEREMVGNPDDVWGVVRCPNH